MTFTSLSFVLFFIAVFILYWIIFNGKTKRQNLFLLASSYFFYGWFEWKLLLLLFGISLANYFIALMIQRTDKKIRRTIFISGLIINIGTLFLFKYLHFFIDAFSSLLSFSGFHLDLYTTKIILPLGISFYIFLSLSYLIDVYKQKLVADPCLIDVLLAFSFFPIIIAGPIHRPLWLLPQIKMKRTFSYDQATDGVKQILWGLFMKILIADQCAGIVNTIFTDFRIYPASVLLIGIFLFTIQIYADFAGYSNLAIGVAKLLGFSIIKNFAYPYFARDIREYWKRWNISLTMWFRDYIFLPVAYTISGKLKSDRFFGVKSDILIYTIGITITWMLTGLWHGANFTFIIWGLLQGLFLFLFHISIKRRKRLLQIIHINNKNKLFIFLETIITFCFVMFSWIFFRSDSIQNALAYLSRLLSKSLFHYPAISMPGMDITFAFLVIFLTIEWFGKKHEYAIAGWRNNLPKALRWTIYYAMLLAIFWFAGEQQQFIYFKF